ncbi:MAG: MFS transporter [Spirochaetales bacterium]|nr:MFS transporter [Spirochaetales bacterium]
MKENNYNTGPHVSLGTKIGYGLGDFGANLVYQTIMLFLMFYFTDVFLLPAGLAGTIILTSKIWDAVSDPLIGYSSDKTKSRWGSKRPYLLFGAIPLGLSMFFLFYSPDLSGNGRFIYGLSAFLLLCTAYTVVNIPYGALTASLTTDTHERSSITGYRTFFAILATVFVAGATRPIVSLFSSEQTGWRYTGLLYGALVAVLTLITFASVRENTRSGPLADYKISDIGKVILANRPFLILASGMTMHMIAIGVLGAMINYFFKYNYNREAFIPVALLIMFGTSALAIPLWVRITGILGKARSFNTGMIIVALSLISLFFMGEFNQIILIPLLILAGTGISTLYFSPWAMIPDTVEYSQWKTGLRREGILYGFFYFSQKLAAAISGFITGLGLSLSRYIQPESISDSLSSFTQSPETLLGIRLLTCLVPTVFIAAGLLIIRKYPIDAGLHKEILEKIGLNTK